MADVAPADRLPPRTLAGYAIGSLATGGFSTLPGLVLVYYLTDTLGVAALAAGILVTVAKIWDIVIDPVIGAASDADLARTGSRRRVMVIGGAAIPILFALTFAVPAGIGTVGSGLWVLLAFLAAATAFSLFQVPYIALPAELTAGYHERTRLLTWRVVVLTFAIVLFGAGGPALRGAVEDPRAGYLLMAVVSGVLLGAGMLLSTLIVPRGTPGQAGARAGIAAGYRAGFDVLRRSRPFRALLGAFALQGLATGMMLAGAQYVATYVLHSEDAVTLLFLALIAPALVFAPVWGAVSRRIGKERAFTIASVLFAVAAGSLLLLIVAPGGWVYVPVGVAGAAYAGLQSLPLAMLPDVISEDARVSGPGAAGAFGGVWTAGETTGMALGSTALTLVLAATGYAERVAGETVTQSSAAVTGIILSFSILPAALVALSLWPLSRYRLRRADIDAGESAREGATA